MRKALMVAVMLLTAPASAHPLCEFYESMADMAIEGKYLGYPLSRAMETTEALSEPTNREIVRKIWLLAYKLPHVPSYERRQQADDFRNLISSICYASLFEGGLMD